MISSRIFSDFYSKSLLRNVYIFYFFNLLQPIKKLLNRLPMFRIPEGVEIK